MWIPILNTGNVMQYYYSGMHRIKSNKVAKTTIDHR